MSRYTLAWLLLVVGPLAAAPVPKVKVTPVEVRKLHDRIAEAVTRGDWSDDDTRAVEEKVTALLGKMTTAADAGEWKLPVAFKGLKVVAPAEVKVVTQEALIVGGDVSATALSGCVVVSRGAVEATSITNCVVIAQTVRCTFADNTIVIADEYARATSWGIPGRGGCAVVAGKRIRATGIDGGMFHVIAPDLTCNAGDGRADPADRRPVVTTVASNATFLVDETAPPTDDKDCKRVELKAPIAK